MANYYDNFYNRFIDHAGAIARRLSGGYLDELEGRLLDCGEDRIDIGPMGFVRILQYRRTESVQSDLALIRRGMEDCVAYCAGRGAAIGYFIVSRDGECAVYLGVEGTSSGKLQDKLSAVVPEIAFRPGFLPSAELDRLARYGGVVTGDVECRQPVADALLAALGGVNGMVALLAVPMEDREVKGYTSALHRLRQTAEYLSESDQTYSSQTGRTARRSFPFVPEIAETAKRLADHYGSSRESFWKTCIWFGCQRQGDLAPVGSAVAAALSAASGGRARVFYTTDNPLRTGSLSLPTAVFGELTYTDGAALEKPSLLAYSPASHLASVMQLPANTARGFEVIQLEKDKNSLHLFDLFGGEERADSIRIGEIAETGQPYCVALKDMTEHLLVTGATGAGKSNSVKILIKGVHRAGVPVLIVEPAKTDYWKMAGEMRGLRIFSFG